MLYETLAQPEVLFFICIFGFLSGVIFDIANFIFVLCEKNKIVRHILDFLATIIVSIVFFVLILSISYGEIRLWQILFFASALLLERATIGKIVAKGLFLCYNFFINLLKRFKARKDEKK